MGATFSVVHVRGASVQAVTEFFTRSLLEMGFRAATKEDSGSPYLRRIAVWQNGIWISLLDEGWGPNPQRTNPIGIKLSAHFHTAALSVVSYDSDVVWMSAFENGAKVGAASSPRDAKAFSDGRRRLCLDWLAKYAKDDAGKKILTEGVRADHTLAEEVLNEIGTPLGIDEPCYTPEEDEDDKFLCFLPTNIPELPEVPPRLAVGGHPLKLHGFAGKPFQWGIHFSLTGTPKASALEVVCWGGGVKLIEIQSVILRGIEGHRVLESRADPKRRGDPDVLYFEIPESFMRDGRRLADEGLNPRRAAALVGDGLYIRGRCLHPGVDELNICARYRDEPDSAAIITLPVCIENELYEPILPEPKTPLPAEYAEWNKERKVYAIDEYTDPRFIIGWCSWDCPWSKIEKWVLGAATELAAMVLNLAKAGILKLSLVSAGQTIRGLYHFMPGDDLLAARWRKRRDALRIEGALRLVHTTGELSELRESGVVVFNQPNGDTSNIPEDRERYRNIGHCEPRPVKLLWAMPPVTGADDRSCEKLMDRIITEAADLPGCVGGFVTTAKKWWSYDGACPYESLCEIPRSTPNPEDIADWLREHLRTPGWRVIIPRAAMKKLGAAPPEIELVECLSGKLLILRARSPRSITQSQRRAVEQFLLPALPSGDQWNPHLCFEKYRTT